MARHVIELITDDIDGEEIPDGGGEEVTLQINKTRYMMDLRSANVQKLHEALAPFIKNARRSSAIDNVRAIGSGSSSARSSSGLSAKELKRVREWAAANNVQVAGRGRVPADVIEQWRAAQGRTSAAQG